MAPASTISFGPFEFDCATGRLSKHGYRAKLHSKPTAVLSALLKRPDEIVGKAKLRSALWPDGTYIGFDLGIKVAVRKLRDALGDSADKPVYIE